MVIGGGECKHLVAEIHEKSSQKWWVSSRAEFFLA